MESNKPQTGRMEQITMTRITTTACLMAIALLAGCQQQQAVEEPAIGPTLKDYGRPLPPGVPALRLVTDPARMPDFAAAFQHRDAFLFNAIDHSLQWFASPSSRRFFPVEDITHEQAEASVRAFYELMQSAGSASDFEAELLRKFDVYKSVGYNGDGIVLFTGYYAPVFDASRDRTLKYAYPLYTRPDDLVTNPITGEPKGQRLGPDHVVPYATRREIEESNMFAGRELVWLPDALSAYIIHVNGSAKLRLRDGSIMYVGYAGKTDRPYASLGRAMVRAGLLEDGSVTLQAIKRVYRRQPERVRELMYENQNYVFFTEYSGADWPAGSLGVPVTRETSLATDKSIYPRGGIVLVDTKAVTFSYDQRDFLRFMLDQDTGGAIKAPGRADIFMGVGPSAEILAGGQYAEGRLYYLFLKPDYTQEYVLSRARDSRS
jgi:membrane-bound lytic murein transglycosylase A